MKHVVLIQVIHHWFIPICRESPQQAIFDTVEEAQFEAKRQLEYYGKRGFKNIKIGIIEEKEHIFNEEVDND